MGEGLPLGKGRAAGRGFGGKLGGWRRRGGGDGRTHTHGQLGVTSPLEPRLSCKLVVVRGELAAGGRGRLCRSPGVRRAAAASPGCSGAPAGGGSAGGRRARFVWKNQAGFLRVEGGEAAGAEAATHHAWFSAPSTFAKGRLK